MPYHVDVPLCRSKFSTLNITVEILVFVKILEWLKFVGLCEKIIKNGDI